MAKSLSSQQQALAHMCTPLLFIVPVKCAWLCFLLGWLLQIRAEMFPLLRWEDNLCVSFTYFALSVWLYNTCHNKECLRLEKRTVLYKNGNFLLCRPACFLYSQSHLLSILLLVLQRQYSLRRKKIILYDCMSTE